MEMDEMFEVKVESVSTMRKNDDDAEEVNADNSNILPEFCQACLTANENNDLKDMAHRHLYNGRYEMYSEMLDYCFSMKLEKKFKDQIVRLICESCILKLRNVVDFKIQMENAQQNIKQNLGISTFQPPSYLSSKKAVDDEFENSNGGVLTLYVEDVDSDDSLYDNESLFDDDIIKKPPPVRNITQKNKKQNKLKRYDNAPVTNGRRVLSPRKPQLTPKQKVTTGSSIVVRPHVPYGRRVRYNHLPYKLTPEQRKCHICNEVFESRIGIQQHMPTHFPNFTCDVCGRVFASSLQISRHKKSHVPEIIECSLCPGKRFKTREYLAVHKKCCHQNFRINKCPHCDDRFNNFRARQRHLVNVHGMKPKRYKCKLCDVTFQWSSSRSVHFRKVHLNERSHTCHICNFSFYGRGNLNKHMVIHTGERNFPCSVCKKRFQRKSTLKEHMKIHTGEKNHVCHICDKAFTQKCSLKGHMALHEKEALKSDS